MSLRVDFVSQDHVPEMVVDFFVFPHDYPPEFQDKAEWPMSKFAMLCQLTQAHDRFAAPFPFNQPVDEVCDKVYLEFACQQIRFSFPISGCDW